MFGKEKATFNGDLRRFNIIFHIEVFEVLCYPHLMFKNIAQARKILEQEHLIVKLDAGEIDRYEFIRQLFNLRRYEPDIVITEDEIEKQFNFIPIFRGAVEIANDMVSSEKTTSADGGVKADSKREQKLTSN